MVLSAKGITRFIGSNCIVDNIDIFLDKGECLGILGPNGAGKTTTLEMLEGVQRPDCGEILFCGKPIKRHYREVIGIQFQATTLPDYLNVKECIELYQSFYKRNIALDKLLYLCQLEGLEQRLHFQLSGGERQRLLLALSLVNDPLLLFLDEPTTGLDPTARMNFWRILESIKAESKSILLTTHYMHEAEYLCDKVMVLNKGSVIAEGAPTSLLQTHFKPIIASVDADYFSGLGSATRKDKPIIFELDSTEQLNQVLASHKLSNSNVNLRKPTLDDLFIKLTEVAS